MSTAPVDLMDPAALERCADEGSLAGVVTDWSERLAMQDDDLRRVVLAALRVDLAAIVAAPAMLFPCLYNRVYWHGSAEAAAFYGEGMDAGAPLRAWAERWRATRRRGQAWGRSLRPPEFPLLAALREEYRAALPDAGELLFTRDGEVVGFASPSAIAWQRATGARVSDAWASSQSANEPGWRLELEQGSERLGHVRVRDVESGTRVLAVAVDNGTRFVCVAGLPGRAGVLVGGSFEGDEGTIARIDRPGVVRWKTHASGEICKLAIDGTGTLVAASDGTRVHLLDAASGAALGCAPIESHDVALSFDGSLLVTRAWDLLRVWDVGELRRGRLTRIVGASEGYIAASFSPDGQRLVTGKLLCDGRDGRLIARLPLEAPVYLEGGPPPRGRRLADDRFVEMSPFTGVSVWRAVDGSRHKVHASGRYGHGNEVSLSPDCRWFVVSRFMTGPDPVDLSLISVDDGDRRVALGVGDPKSVVFTPDSQHVLLASKTAVKLWCLDTGELLATWMHPDTVTGVAMASDGTCIVTGARDRVLRVWDLTRRGLRGARVMTDEDLPLRSWSSTSGARSDGGRPTGTRGRVLRVWSLVRRVLRGARAVTDDNVAGWRPTAPALARVEGWLGFHRATPARTVRRHAGWTEIVEAGRVVVRLPARPDIVADATGTRWAGRTDHYAVEDDVGEV